MKEILHLTVECTQNKNASVLRLDLLHKCPQSTKQKQRNNNQTFKNAVQCLVVPDASSWHHRSRWRRLSVLEATLRWFVVEGHWRRSWRVQITHYLVEAGDLLFQQVVLLLCDLLPLLSDLQSLQQLSVLHVQVFDQDVRFAVLMQLEKQQQQQQKSE